MVEVTSLAQRYYETWSAHAAAKEELDLALRRIFGIDELADDRWSRVSCDPVDWEGSSVEFDEFTLEPPTDEQCEHIWALGFTVIRIDYADPAKHTSQHRFHGDWSRVKGRDPWIARPRPTQSPQESTP